MNERTNQTILRVFGVAIFVAACAAAGVSSGCAARAGLTEEDARDELQQCNQNNDGESCMLVAHRYYDGVGASEDPVLAHDLYRRGCRYGSEASCVEFALSEYEQTGSFDGAIGALERSCRRYNLEACDLLAQVLDSDMTSSPDAARAERIRERLCSIGWEWSCEG